MLVSYVDDISVSQRSPLNHFFEQVSKLHYKSAYDLLLTQTIVMSSYVHYELTHFKHYKEIRIGSHVLNGY